MKIAGYAGYATIFQAIGGQRMTMVPLTDPDRTNVSEKKSLLVLDNTGIVIPLNSVDFPFRIPNRVQCDASALNIQKETVISLRRQF